MPTELALKQTTEITTTSLDEATYSALKNSVFPGAKDESINMVLAYCKARSLDPLQKPVHIVPMYVKDNATGQGGMRDIVMPGIALYRIQAQRSGAYAGQSDPEFGEEVSERLNGVEISYPKWCKVTVSKLMPNGEIVDFSAKEFWKENYATAGKDSAAPNAMWKKRPYAQLAKCAEAQALRKAFPDILDHTPTAEEMEGKHFEQSEPSKASTLNKELKINKVVIVDNATGEITERNLESGEEFVKPIEKKTQEEPSNEPFTYEEIKQEMSNAKTHDELTDLASVVPQLTLTKEQKDDLTKVYREVSAKLKKAM